MAVTTEKEGMELQGSNVCDLPSQLRVLRARSTPVQCGCDRRKEEQLKWDASEC